MKRPIATILTALLLCGTALNAETVVATVSYRRSPSFLNGRHVRGIWSLKPGDVVTTGGGRARVNAKYPDSTFVGIQPNADVVFQAGWLDIRSGTITVNLVAGSKLLTKLRTPLGELKLFAATMKVQVQRDGQMTVSSEYGRVEADLRGTRLIVDEGDSVAIVYTEDAKRLEAKVKVGSVQVTTTDGKTVTLAKGDKADLGPAPPLPVGKARTAPAKPPSTTSPPAESKKPGPKVSPVKRVSLPQDHAYQKTLRVFLATLKEKDFAPTHGELKAFPPSDNPDERFRMWLMSLKPPAVGRKRNYSSVMVSAAQFTLDAIEGAESIMRPAAHPEPLADLAGWNYPGNPYFNSRALKLRAFVITAIDMMMMDDLYERRAKSPKNRSDFLAGMLLRMAYTYPGVRDVLSPEARRAFETGLKKLTLRLIEWGPHGAQKEWDMMGAPALLLAARALNDPKVARAAEAYARDLFTDPKFFSPAGYFVHAGSLDSFNGISTYFAAWAAAASDWSFARDAIAKVCRLRAHLTLPQPGGGFAGPNHMAVLTSADPARPQWDWIHQHWAAAFVSDEAAYKTSLPSADKLKDAPRRTVGEVRYQLKELSWRPGGLDPVPWNVQTGGTVVNFAYQYYPKGYYARRAAAEKARPSLCTLPCMRGDNFVRTFGDEFVVAKAPGFVAIVHTGPSGEGNHPLGFSGGALSAFWTPKGGSLLLGRNRGAWKTSYDESFKEWRTWPTHCVSGITPANLVFTSAKILRPRTVFRGDNTTDFTVEVSGEIPPDSDPKGPALTGKLLYARTFKIAPGGLRVSTTVESDGKDIAAEMYEVLPVYLRDLQTHRKLPPTKIEFLSAGKWKVATSDYAENVSAVRLTHYEDTVRITFDRVRRVKLSPSDWLDGYMSHAACRNILIDLLESGDRPVALDGEKTIRYEIAPRRK